MIRAYLFLFFAGLVAMVVQTTVVPYLFADRIHLDLILVMVVLLGLFRDPVQGAIMAFFLGGIQDVFTGQMDGLFLFSRTLIFILANLLRHRFSALSPGAQFIFTLILGVADKLLLALLLFWFSSPEAAAFSRWPFLLGEVLLNAALAPLLYPLLGAVPNLFEARSTRG